jgi:hypothetical protein
MHRSWPKTFLPLIQAICRTGSRPGPIQEDECTKTACLEVTDIVGPNTIGNTQSLAFMLKNACKKEITIQKIIFEEKKEWQKNLK